MYTAHGPEKTPNMVLIFFLFRVHFISNTLIRKARLKLPKKNQANHKQHPEAELLLFKNYTHSSWTLSPKRNKTYSKK